ncbi:3'(2'),5'-bisphosphate nucleotidase CysQ [Mesorhizobium microcysteis]|uniref:3'(2'),5'-bisphosphate nucleotidase CysQ n=1 Tax=Neoaquamicrobium microcysteis TaxID=2682781 RepID=A0A5D4GW20_9HYPH|nr:3'(2'),5'-bisphosphate nucleotidase CysQ [Mesorhizobium microcysteis]TYR31989.1 3'(2'),5'-bisphosphate nucleotidase CysQ [Mesorhizobium microcysteis]
MQASDRVSEDLTADLALIRDAAREGGEIAMRHFGRDPDTWMKNGTSPVTAADIAVDNFLRETLRAARPAYGWLSEETVDGPERLSAARTFVVDPIDGTRAFIDGKRTWCVSIAVVENGVSLAGVLDCPARGEIYEAVAGGAALMNGTAIAVTQPGPAPRIAGPKPMLQKAPAYMRARAPIPYVPSLAYRIAMVASGELDATFVKPNSHDWDLAAADLILRQAGGAVLDETGSPPLYAGRDPRHGALVAGSGALLREMARLIAVEH